MFFVLHEVNSVRRRCSLGIHICPRGSWFPSSRHLFTFTLKGVDSLPRSTHCTLPLRKMIPFLGALVPFSPSRERYAHCIFALKGVDSFLRGAHSSFCPTLISFSKTLISLTFEEPIPSSWYLSPQKLVSSLMVLSPQELIPSLRCLCL